jgi:DNA replication protein DnaC
VPSENREKTERCRRVTPSHPLSPSNKSFSEMAQVFGDDALTTAILDRLLHHAEIITINGPS